MRSVPVVMLDVLRKDRLQVPPVTTNLAFEDAELVTEGQDLSLESEL